MEMDELSIADDSATDTPTGSLADRVASFLKDAAHAFNTIAGPTFVV
jgi:hypothetical protein